MCVAVHIVGFYTKNWGRRSSLREIRSRPRWCLRYYFVWSQLRIQRESANLLSLFSLCNLLVQQQHSPNSPVHFGCPNFCRWLDSHFSGYQRTVLVDCRRSRHHRHGFSILSWWSKHYRQLVVWRRWASKSNCSYDVIKSGWNVLQLPDLSMLQCQGQSRCKCPRKPCQITAPFSLELCLLKDDKLNASHGELHYYCMSSLLFSFLYFEHTAYTAFVCCNEEQNFDHARDEGRLQNPDEESQLRLHYDFICIDFFYLQLVRRGRKFNLLQIWVLWYLAFCNAFRAGRGNLLLWLWQVPW